MSKKKNIAKQKESWYIFSICILSILLVGSLYLFFDNPYLNNIPASTGIKPLGEIVNLSVEDNGSASETVYFYGSVLPNFVVQQEVNVILKSNQQNAKARAKIFLFNDENKVINIEAESTQDWVRGEDNYYYYQSTLTPNSISKVFKGIKIPDIDCNLSSSNIYNIIITVETLPENTDYESIWKLT